MQSDNTADTGTDTLISFNERPDTPIFPFPRFYGECLNLPEPNRFYHLWSSCGQYYLVFDAVSYTHLTLPTIYSV